MTTITKTPQRIVFWRAAGCFKSPLAILETLEDPNNGLHMKDGRPIFIRSLNGSKYIPRDTDMVINWGNAGLATFPELKDAYQKLKFRMLNKPAKVAIGSNKLESFKAFLTAGVASVPFTTDKEIAKEWLNKGMVIARKSLTGCCGEGIVVIDPTKTTVLPNAPLYTKYVKKTHEYRVHVFNEKVIDVTIKKLQKGKDPKGAGIIRNVNDGWKFSHAFQLEPEDQNILNNLGVAAVKACGLDIGAVDIIWNKYYNKYYVLEVNTAPGLELRKTIDAYANAILDLSKKVITK